MPEELELIKPENLEAKKDVFYVRCRPTIKKVLLLKMNQDGFTSMADWFDQFVTKAIVPKKGKTPSRVPKKGKKK